LRVASNRGVPFGVDGFGGGALVSAEKAGEEFVAGAGGAFAGAGLVAGGAGAGDAFGAGGFCERAEATSSSAISANAKPGQEISHAARRGSPFSLAPRFSGV